MGGITIKGLQKAQQKMNRRIEAMEPQGKFGQLIRMVTVSAFRFTMSIIHVDTGSARAALAMDVTDLRGDIFFDRNAVNPQTRLRPSDYMQAEFKRGGEHDTPKRVIIEMGPRVSRFIIDSITAFTEA